MTQKMFHMNVKIFSRGKGHNFTQKLCYRDGGIRTDLETGRTINYHRKHFSEKIENDFIVPEGADESLHNRNDYYDSLEQKEKAKNAQYFREFEVAFPNDLSKEDNKDIARKFGESLAAEGMFVDINYHKLDSNNPHAHILTSMRGVNEKGLLGNKNREWNNKENLDKWRGKFAEIINEKYKERGIDNYVDHRSYKKQGVDKLATKKLPVDKKSKEYRERIILNKDVRRINADKRVTALSADLKYLKKNIINRTKENKSITKLIDKKKELKKEFTLEKIKLKREEKFFEHRKTLQKSKVNQNKKARDRGLSL